jgi:hypothetical protein
MSKHRREKEKHSQTVIQRQGGTHWNLVRDRERQMQADSERKAESLEQFKKAD